MASTAVDRFFGQQAYLLEPFLSTREVLALNVVARRAREGLHEGLVAPGTPGGLRWARRVVVCCEADALRAAATVEPRAVEQLEVSVVANPGSLGVAGAPLAALLPLLSRLGARCQSVRLTLHLLSVVLGELQRGGSDVESHFYEFVAALGRLRQVRHFRLVFALDPADQSTFSEETSRLAENLLDNLVWLLNPWFTSLEELEFYKSTRSLCDYTADFVDGLFLFYILSMPRLRRLKCAPTLSLRNLYNSAIDLVQRVIWEDQDPEPHPGNDASAGSNAGGQSDAPAGAGGAGAEELPASSASAAAGTPASAEIAPAVGDDVAEARDGETEAAAGDADAAAGAPTGAQSGAQEETTTPAPQEAEVHTEPAPEWASDEAIEADGEEWWEEGEAGDWLAWRVHGSLSLDIWAAFDEGFVLCPELQAIHDAVVAESPAPHPLLPDPRRKAMQLCRALSVLRAAFSRARLEQLELSIGDASGIGCALDCGVPCRVLAFLLRGHPTLRDVAALSDCRACSHFAEGQCHAAYRQLLKLLDHGGAAALRRLRVSGGLRGHLATAFKREVLEAHGGAVTFVEDPPWRDL